MEEIVKICREAGKTSKVIFENCYLTDDEKRKVAEIAKEVKPDLLRHLPDLEQVELQWKMLN